MDTTKDLSITGTPIDSEEDLVQLVGDCLWEADQPRRRYVSRGELNLQQHLGEYGTDETGPGFTQPHHSAFILNKTVNSDIAHTQAQIEQRPRITITPRENGSVAEQFWIGREALMTIKDLMDQGHIGMGTEGAPDEQAGLEAEAGMMIGEQPDAPQPRQSEGFDFAMLESEPDADAFQVDEAFLKRNLLLFDQEGQAMIAPDMPFTPWQSDRDKKPMHPILTAEDVITINDGMIAEIINNNCNILWDISDCDAMLTENVYVTNIVGWEIGLYEWDAERGFDVVTNLHTRHAWLPPEAYNVEQSEYAIVREPMSKVAAMNRVNCMKEVQNKAEVIKAITDYSGVGGVSTTGPGTTLGVEPGKPFTATSFKRVMIDWWTFWQRGTPYPMAADQALNVGKVALVEEQYFIADEDGKPTDEKTAPDEKNWPTYYGIRQIQVIADKVVQDIECPHFDIPLLLNKCIPVPFRWIGQGQPERLEWLSRLIMRVASTIYDILRYSRSPQELYPSDVYDALVKNNGLGKMYSHPARQISLDATLWVKYRDVLVQGRGFLLEAPQVPAGAADFLMLLCRLHDELSGNTAEVQGRTTSAGQSGKSIEMLQNAARGLMAFEASQTESMLKRLTKMRIHAMCKRGWLTPRLWQRFNDKYPSKVLEAVREAAKDVDFNVSVEVASGGGQIRQTEQQAVREDFQAGIIDQETTLKKLDSYSSEAKEIIGRIQAQAAAQQAADVAAKPAPQPKAA